MISDIHGDRTVEVVSGTDGGKVSVWRAADSPPTVVRFLGRPPPRLDAFLSYFRFYPYRFSVFTTHAYNNLLMGGPNQSQKLKSMHY